MMDTLILKTATRILLPLLLLFSIFLFLRGHNEPGGGFVGGLVASGAVAVYAMGSGVLPARKLLRVPPRWLIGGGLLLGLLSSLLPLLFGHSFLAGLWLETTLPGWGEIHLGTPLLFDLGVFCVVNGVATEFVFAFLEEA
ncbi:Na(+)/H(+) antiporter subunit B [Novipirellula aureliae]|uniref:Na(+)/H(+) antiporter subunit B n=1 Tax=Novipirellula aureliae TaxID=2527966 RepID=A0A5C6E855_9BACT|nr:Na+/H+ antiporter subunit B [Novipirellula aureliae]TWU45020.1 Na(+)/H(+) antiporter subunit B [Novipirellula aureliae]